MIASMVTCVVIAGIGIGIATILMALIEKSVEYISNDK